MSADQYGLSQNDGWSTNAVNRPDDDVGGLIARVAEPDGSDRRARERALAAVIPVLGRHARAAGFRAVAAGRWLTDEIVDLAPRVPVRDAPTLHSQFVGLTDMQIGEQLIASAARVTAGIGAAAGGIAALEFAAPPALLAAPVQLAAEMLVVTAVELKMVAELHELFEQPATGGPTDRAGRYLLAWVRRRAVAPEVGATALASVFGTAAKRELRAHVIRRMGRSSITLAPLFAGAVAGAEINRRTTRALGEALLGELYGRGEQRWFRQLGPLPQPAPPAGS